MSAPLDPPPLRIPPPDSVRRGAWLVLLEAAGLLVLAVAGVVSGWGDAETSFGRLAAQTGYYVVLAVLVGACALALLDGRRWGRTPAFLVQVVMVLIGVWLIVPSQRWFWGPVVIALGVVTGTQLLSRSANAWIERFPTPFGPEPRR
ncbi:hypothetical protein JL107_11215 [Nakamurella flavida]|uniref:Integral membrane protein n=1 Tax=Nakamurella flavida TaxID=363630 RepID=A0A938YLQ9_9ACTN|nr:hypothetical protein [Nakamurella flavida]MBM9477018.1 hypothetical protein [Nakamurella flavida]MDP9779963.1 hypothetical protein [Nakamurella flavida]